MFNFKDEAREGFSNRRNVDQVALQAHVSTILRHCHEQVDGDTFVGGHVEVTATRKVDGVASVVVAFVVSGDEINDIGGNVVKWDWDNVDSDAQNQGWSLSALKQFLLPELMWSKRSLDDGNDYLLNVCLYTPTEKAIMIPHYLRAEIEDYVLAYYVQNGYQSTSRCLAFRTEIFMGKREPSDITAWLRTRRSLHHSIAGEPNSIFNWSLILYFLKMSSAKCKDAMIYNKKESVRRKLETLRDEKDFDLKNARLQKSLEGTVKTLQSDHEAATDTLMEILNNEKVINKQATNKKHAGHERVIGFINYLLDLQWNTSDAVEEFALDNLKSPQNTIPRQLGVVVLDDYSTIISENWMSSRAKKLSESFRAYKPVNTDQSYRKRLDNLPQHESRLVHRVQIKHAETYQHDENVANSFYDNVCADLDQDIGDRNIEGYMITVQEMLQSKTGATNDNNLYIFKLKKFIGICMSVDSFKMDFGLYKRSEDDIEEDKRIMDSMSSSIDPHSHDEELEFLNFLALVNANHFNSVNNYKVLKRTVDAEQQKRIYFHSQSYKNAAMPEGANLYEPWILGMLPWGTFKNINCDQMIQGNKVLVSDFLNTYSKDGSTKKFMLWLQYIRNTRARLMCAPYPDVTNSSIILGHRVKRYIEQHNHIQEIAKSPHKDHKRRFVTEMFTIALLAHASYLALLDGETIWHRLGPILKQLVITGLGYWEINHRVQTTAQKKSTSFAKRDDYSKILTEHLDSPVAFSNNLFSTPETYKKFGIINKNPGIKIHEQDLPTQLFLKNTQNAHAMIDKLNDTHGIGGLRQPIAKKIMCHVITKSSALLKWFLREEAFKRIYSIHKNQFDDKNVPQWCFSPSSRTSKALPFSYYDSPMMTVLFAKYEAHFDDDPDELLKSSKEMWDNVLENCAYVKSLKLNDDIMGQIFDNVHNCIQALISNTDVGDELVDGLDIQQVPWDQLVVKQTKLTSHNIQTFSAEFEDNNYAKYKDISHKVLHSLMRDNSDIRFFVSKVAQEHDTDTTKLLWFEVNAGGRISMVKQFQEYLLQALEFQMTGTFSATQDETEGGDDPEENTDRVYATSAATEAYNAGKHMESFMDLDDDDDNLDYDALQDSDPRHVYGDDRYYANINPVSCGLTADDMTRLQELFDNVEKEEEHYTQDMQVKAAIVIDDPRAPGRGVRGKDVFDLDDDSDEDWDDDSSEAVDRKVAKMERFMAVLRALCGDMTSTSLPDDGELLAWLHNLPDNKAQQVVDIAASFLRT